MPSVNERPVLGGKLLVIPLIPSSVKWEVGLWVQKFVTVRENR